MNSDATSVQPITSADSGVPPITGDASASSQPRADDGRYTSISEYRYTPEDLAKYGLPEWALGRSAVEVAQAGGNLYSAMLSGQQGAPQPQPAQQQWQAQPAPVQPAVPPQPEGPPVWDDMDPQGSTQRYIEYVAKTKFQPAMDENQQVMAQTAQSLAQVKYPDEYRKWGPEIVGTLAQLPPGQQTPYAVDKIVDMIRAQHVDEIVNERVEAKIKQLQDSGSPLPTGGQPPVVPGPTGVNLQQEELPENYKRLLERHRIDTAKLDEFLMSPSGRQLYGDDITKAREKFIELAKKDDIITEEAFKVG